MSAKFALASLFVAAVGAGSAPLATAQFPGSSTLPATAPTAASGPLSATATAADHPGTRPHRAQVTCAGGELEVRAENSSLNSILREVSRCTGMRVTGGVREQRVFGNYGPAAPATVLATLIDGTGTNMVLRATAADSPTELILTPRTGGPTPPSPNQVADEDEPAGLVPAGTGGSRPGPYTAGAATAQPLQNGAMPTMQGNMQAGSPGQGSGMAGTGYTPGRYPAQQTTQTPAPAAGSTLTGPTSIPLPINNVNGSPSNTSPTASTYPTTNSVPLDSLPTPSTTPSASGIVDAPNPPAPGSDTARFLQGTTAGVPGNTTITNGPTSNATLPGGTNTTTPVPTGAIQPGADATGTASQTTNGNAGGGGSLTPEQVYQQLQQLHQQQQQQQAPTTPSPQ